MANGYAALIPFSRASHFDPRHLLDRASSRPRLLLYLLEIDAQHFPRHVSESAKAAPLTSLDPCAGTLADSITCHIAGQ